MLGKIHSVPWVSVLDASLGSCEFLGKALASLSLSFLIRNILEGVVGWRYSVLAQAVVSEYF